MKHQPIKASPFEGGPATHAYMDASGLPVIEVTMRGLEPFGMKVGQVTGGLTFVASIAAAIAAGSQPGVDDPGVLGSAIFGGGAFMGGTIYALCAATKAEVRFTPTAFMLRRDGLLRGHWQTFNLAHPHHFTMLPHDKATQEQRALQSKKDAAARHGATANLEVIYGDSYHISFNYFGQRNDVITIYGRKEATAIHQRLNACLQIMKARAGNGQTATRPQDHWAPTPGDIPGGGRT